MYALRKISQNFCLHTRSTISTECSILKIHLVKNNLQFRHKYLEGYPYFLAKTNTVREAQIFS